MKPSQRRQIQAILRSLPLAPQPKVQAPPSDPGMFLLYFNNKRKQIRGYQALEAEGVLYSSGHVHVDTEMLRDEEGRLRNTFRSLQEMIDTLQEWGECAVTWLDEVGA